MLYEQEIAPQRAILAGVDLGAYDMEASLDELAELARAAGAQVLGRMTQKRDTPDVATYIGEGKLEELGDFVETQEADLVIFDCELSPSQLRNLEKALDIPVIDRTMLILDIFAARANSSEGKLQVQLAQLRYRLPRLQGMGLALSRMGGQGGIGARRGPGETKLETDRRHIRRRITALEEALRELEERRGRLRERRRKDGVTTVAIVGYTNVGKSTLMEALTLAGVLIEDKLFATLDPTARALLLPDGREVLLVDTVGLIRRLPHHLVEAFHSTLEEAVTADLLLNVCDASSSEWEIQIEVTRELLRELGIGDTPVLTVFNKRDKLDILPELPDKMSVAISARTGQGLDTLLDNLAQALPATQQRVRLLLPYAASGLAEQIAQGGKIFSRAYTEDGLALDALVENRLIDKVKAYIQ